jgi:membrane protease YdiL (CAAX protease family)
VQIQQERSAVPQSRPDIQTANRLGRALLGDQAVWVRRYLALLLVVEVIIRIWGSLPGSVLYALVVLLLVNHQLVVDAAWGNGWTTGQTGLRDLRPVFLVLSLTAIARLSALAMDRIPDVWFGGYGLAVLPMSVALWWLPRVRGLSSSLPWGVLNRRQAAVALVGVPLALGGFLATRPRAELDWWDLTWQLWLAVGLFALSGALEEWFFQGFVRGALGSALGTSGAGASALLYASCHGNIALGALAALVLANIVFGVLARRTGSLVGACLGHALLNVLLAFVLPYIWPH